MNVIIYHNPRCSKSRQTIELLRSNGIEPQIIEYLKTPPDPAQIRRLLRQLGLKAHDLARREESVWQDLDLAVAGEDELIAAMAAHPILIERPIVVCGDRAVIGRPPERVLNLLQVAQKPRVPEQGSAPRATGPGQ